MTQMIVVENYEELSEKAAAVVMDLVQRSSKLTLGLATGSTPIGLYEKLVKAHRITGQSFQQVTTFNLDEYIGIEPTNSNSYYYYMKQHLFNHVDLNAFHLPNGLAKNLELEAVHYEAAIREAGGIDLQILGIGENGHIGFNEPGTPFTSPTHTVKLAESTIKANSRFFPTLEEVPKHAITMGIGTILKSKQILLLAYGEKKAAALQQYLKGTLNENIPATALQMHPNVTIIADKKAAIGDGSRYPK